MKATLCHVVFIIIEFSTVPVSTIISLYAADLNIQFPYSTDCCLHNIESHRRIFLYSEK